MKIDKRKVELLMATRQINPKRLSEIAGVSYPTLHRAYTGRSKPATLGRIAKALGVDVLDIIETEADQ